MNASQTIEHLLKHFYKLHIAKDVIRSYGIGPYQLMSSSGIRVGDALAQLATVERMIGRGWLKIIKRRLPSRTKRLLSSDSIQLTEEGIKEAERLSSPLIIRYFRDICVATIEGIARAFIRH